MPHPDDVVVKDAPAGLDLDSPTAWGALSSDAGAFITVLDSKGTVIHACKSMLTLLREVHPEPLGRTIGELFGPAFASERLSLLERVRMSGTPARLRSMVAGVLLTETYRPLPANSRGVPLFLVTARAASLEADHPDLRPEPDVPVAHVNNLGRLGELTERELELLHHIALGRSSEETAQLMHRSTRTVEWHRASLGQKLGCVNRVQLARIAMRAGLAAVELPFVSALHRSGFRPGI